MTSYKKISIENEYKFSDFTFDNYRKLIQLAKRRFRFLGYKIDLENELNYVIWRHDLEFSIQTACKLAQIEKEEGVKSTFFIQLHSEFYNTLDKRIIQLIRSYLIQSGHTIGLHFDAHFHNTKNVLALEKCILKDKLLLEDILEVPIDIFSFHNTNSFILSCEDDYYGTLLNVYSKKIKQIPYCSDSLGYWRYDRLQDRLEDSSITKLQVLTHDALWSDTPLAPRQRIIKSIKNDGDELLRIYDNYLYKFGHKNIDENGDVHIK